MSRSRSLLLVLLVSISISFTICDRTLVLVGGGLDDNDKAIYSKIVELAGGPGKAFIGIISAASDDPLGNYPVYVNNFMNNGAANVTWIPIDSKHTNNTYDPAVLILLAKQTGIFFPGGDQSLLKSIFQPSNKDTPAMTVLRSMWKRGIVMSGSSAGCDIHQGPPMITDGESYDGLIYGPFATSQPPKTIPDPVTYDPAGGFGFFNLGVLDTHVDFRGRIGRDIALMLASKRLLGFGVDQDTAMVTTITDDGQVFIEIAGCCGVGFYDITDAIYTSSRAGKPPGAPATFTLSNATYHYLTSEDSVVYSTRFPRGHFTFASWKTTLAGRQKYIKVPRISQDIFSAQTLPNGERANPREFILISQTLVNSIAPKTFGLSNQTQPYRIRVNLTNNGGYEGINPQTGLSCISFTNMWLDMYTTSDGVNPFMEDQQH